jgi:hypothetical protein
MKRHKCILHVFEDMCGQLDDRVKILESNGTELERSRHSRRGS